MQQPSSDNLEPRAPAVLILNKDLFFGITVADALRELGYAPIAARSTNALTSAVAMYPDCALVIIDIAAVDNWNTLQTIIDNMPETPSVAFGSHTNVEGLRAAKAVGLTRVFSNGEFHRTMGDVITRYARPLEV